MMNINSSDRLLVAELEPGYRQCWLWCPGCDDFHVITAYDYGDQGWSWDGNVQYPTFEPSILYKGGQREAQCHSFVRSGYWQFLSDSSHHLAGQNVPMVALPDWFFNLVASGRPPQAFKPSELFPPAEEPSGD